MGRKKLEWSDPILVDLSREKGLVNGVELLCQYGNSATSCNNGPAAGQNCDAGVSAGGGGIPILCVPGGAPN